MKIERCTNQEIRSLFEGYMDFMGQFFKIDNREAWHSKAMNYLSSYVDTSNRRIYGLKSSEEPIGFAMVNDELRFNDSGFAIAEFYIDKQHQAKGHGRELSEYVFGQIPGPWEVAVAQENKKAKRFWERVIFELTSGEYKELDIASYEGFGFTFDNAQTDTRKITVDQP